MQEPSPDPKRINAAGLSRDIYLLELLASTDAANSGGYRVADLVQRTGRSKTVISRALTTLTEAGIAARNPETGRYTVGSRIFALAARTAEAQLVRLGRPVLRSLVYATQETCHLSILRHGNVLTIASELSPHALRSAGWEGVRTGAWRTSSGRVLLSGLDSVSLRSWHDVHGQDETVIERESFDREANPFSLVEDFQPTPIDPQKFATFAHEISLIRKNGYAIIDEEFELGIIGISGPVYDHTGEIVAALNVSGPKLRLEHNIAALTRMVRQAGASLSQKLGTRPRATQP